MATPSENKNAGLKTRHVFLDTEVYRRYVMCRPWALEAAGVLRLVNFRFLRETGP